MAKRYVDSCWYILLSFHFCHESKQYLYKQTIKFVILKAHSDFISISFYIYWKKTVNNVNFHFTLS